jgi:hypothetical protein
MSMASAKRSLGNVAKVDPVSQRPPNAEESTPEALVPDIVHTNLQQQSPGGQASLRGRWARIQQRAYQIAQQRGFTPGAELDDWLQAEIEVDAAAGQESPEQQFTG